MRASSLRQPRGPLNRSAARNAALLNLCATPGLGSLMAGRRVVGIGQLLLAVAGFGMFVGWFALRMLQLYNEVVNGVEPKSVAWLAQAGVGTFAAGWLWGLMTSVRILREGRGSQSATAAEPGA